MFTHRNDQLDPSRNPVLRWVRRWVPSTEEYHGQKFWVKKAGKWVAIQLFTVLVLVEVTDIIFAVDSIPAIFAVTQEPFLVFTGNAFAILGLRAMYFLLADLIHRFIYLKAGLAVVLVFVGVKMLLLDAYKVPILALHGRDRHQHHRRRRVEPARHARAGVSVAEPGGPCGGGSV